MAKLPMYEDFQSKKEKFKNGSEDNFIIDKKEALDKLISQITEERLSSKNKTKLIFRGMNEAKHKLITSAQRYWISNDLEQWAGTNQYLDFIVEIIKKGRTNNTLNKVFELYDYPDNSRDFPILSLLQHYGAPTPLMDWTYNYQVALFFAIDGLKKNPTTKSDSIDNYFSIYKINKNENRGELINLFDISPSGIDMNSLREFGDDPKKPKKNNIFYISDFEEPLLNNHPDLKIRTEKPLTTVYNQNIIPQEGLFLFNPFKEKSIEDIFCQEWGIGSNLHLTAFDCYNIHKDLSEYLLRKLNIGYNTNRSFIFPDLWNEASKIKEETLNSYLKLV